MNSHTYIMFYTSLVCLFLCKVVVLGSLNTTFGFVSQRLTQSNFDIQRPYNVPLEQRYNFFDGVYNLWVLKIDKPHSKRSKTNPRTEIRIRGYDYSSGVWQFQAYGYVPRGTTGVSVMQIFGAKYPHAMTMMLRVFNTSLCYYEKPVLLSNVYNKWFRLNVIHDVERNNVQVYIDGVLKYNGPGLGRGNISHYFKCGVYSMNDGSFYMESGWKDIEIFKRPT